MYTVRMIVGTCIYACIAYRCVCILTVCMTVDTCVHVCIIIYIYVHAGDTKFAERYIIAYLQSSGNS